MNWPVAKKLAPFLASLGEATFPAMDNIFQTNDLIWQYWCMDSVIGNFAPDVADRYRALLTKIARTPTGEQKHHELNQVSLEVMVRFGWD